MSRFLPPLNLAPLLGLVLILAGCGFQPRGTTVATGVLPERIQIRGLATYDPLYRRLARELSRAGSTAVSDPQTGVPVLYLYDHVYDQRILTLDSTANVIEYELEEAVRFRLSDPAGESRVADQRVRVLQTVFAPPSGVLGYNREIDAVREDMRRDLTQRILNRIAAQN